MVFRLPLNSRISFALILNSTLPDMQDCIGDMLVGKAVYDII
jgi:hypothetical protein